MEQLNAPQTEVDGAQPPRSVEDWKARERKLKETEDSLAQALGSERVKEFKLMENGEYRSLFESSVTKEVVFQVQEMRRDAEEAAGRLRKDESLTKEARSAALQAIRMETEQSLAVLLGERRAKAYPNNGGHWLRSIAPRE